MTLGYLWLWGKMENYKKYSDYLKNTYGEKVYKIPINLPTTCPNRDNTLSSNGCTFCGEIGVSFECLPSDMSVKSQLDKNIIYIGKKYKAEKFIAYFQNFSNTYLPLSEFEKYMNDAVRDDVVEISVSTRPDCINYEYLEVLNNIKTKKNINITIELGLQSVNYKSLIKINRGHTLAEFLECVNMIKKYDFKICAHVILNLPLDDMIDVIETAKIISALKIDFVKLHSLFIVKNTVMEKEFQDGLYEPLSENDYVDRVVTFLQYLDENIYLQRLIGRASKDESPTANFNRSWRKIQNDIEKRLIDNNITQGDLCNYLGGKALKSISKTRFF